MKFALLATTLLVLLLTSICGASAQDSHEDDGGCRQVLVKRSLIESSSENSPPMPPRLDFDLERGKPKYYVMRIREELEREKRKQSAVGPSRRRWSTTRNAVRPVKGPIGENIALSDDTIDQTDDEETYNVETESDSSSTRRRESAWGHNNVPRTMTRGSKHLKGSKIGSSEPSEEVRKQFKIVPSVYKSMSTTSSSSRTPSAYLTPSPSWERPPAHTLFSSHDPVTHSDKKGKAVNPREQRRDSSMRSSSATYSDPNAVPSAYWGTSAPTHHRVSSSPSMSYADSMGDWKLQRDLQRDTGKSRSNDKMQRISFRDHLAAEKPLFMEEMELTPEQFSLLSHARTRQDFHKLASTIQFPFKLTEDQVKKLENEGKFDNQFKNEVRNFRKRNSTRAKRWKNTWERMQTQGSFDAPESYKGLEGEEFKRLRVVLTTLLGIIKAIEAGKESLDLVDGQDLRLVDQWTQEDLDWWKGYLEFRKTFHRIRKTEQLLQEIEFFFTQGKGRGKRPPNETNKGKKVHFRPVKAYEETGRKAT